MTREKLGELKKLEQKWTDTEDAKRAFDNCVNHGGDPRLAIRKLLEDLNYHPSQANLKAICDIFLNDLDQKRAEALVAFETA